MVLVRLVLVHSFPFSAVADSETYQLEYYLEVSFFHQLLMSPHFRSLPLLSLFPFILPRQSVLTAVLLVEIRLRLSCSFFFPEGHRSSRRYSCSRRLIEVSLSETAISFILSSSCHSSIPSLSHFSCCLFFSNLSYAFHSPSLAPPFLSSLIILRRLWRFISSMVCLTWWMPLNRGCSVLMLIRLWT